VHPVDDSASDSDVPKPFSGGEMVFYPDRVTLCGATVAEGHTRI